MAAYSGVIVQESLLFYGCCTRSVKQDLVGIIKEKCIRNLLLQTKQTLEEEGTRRNLDFTNTCLPNYFEFFCLGQNLDANHMTLSSQNVT